MITAETVFESIRSKWPEKIEFEISTNSAREGQAIWEIVRAYENIESKIDAEQEPFLHLANWCFNQAITAVAKTKNQPGRSQVLRSEVTLLEFDKRVTKNLKESGWEHEFAQYISADNVDDE